MKSRGQLFSIFQKFFAEICTHFNTSISILRSDNALEYPSVPFSSFLSFTWDPSLVCAYTPQHNGVAKRKNHHLVATACTLLLYHNVPQRF